MDINYHYFAVKTLACEAGFEESEAQIIATFSQYIDDFNLYAFCKYTNIPEYIKKKPYDLYIKNKVIYNFNPVTTGFWDTVDMALLITQRSQKFTVSPFHFIPKDKENVENKNYRATPAVLGNESYISLALINAREIFWQAEGPQARKWALMHIGMLLHTFADTYAHQLFSGYNENCNAVKLISVINNITNVDETKKYQDSIVEWLTWFHEKFPKITPCIGHMMLNHIPDLTHLSFTMQYPLAGGENLGTYGRSNTSEFVRASKEIFDFLRTCRKENITSDGWDELSQKLASGFLVDISEISKEKEIVFALKKHWKNYFNHSYEYDHTKVLNGAVSSSSVVTNSLDIYSDKEDILEATQNEDFYKFNMYADELLIDLYGSEPRKTWYNKELNSCNENHLPM